ncbi:hypothetical protein MTR67_049134 [Solanum verrucosum]|uniref:Reverse transcriptase domain-containing protein n=1 Tax=Solanum verrucosum TaxID=315347 RepID=A0AAF0V1W3_SOLVR|nr:hypothetical protein MTR67_049134 [Solanum verrucosum]
MPEPQKNSLELDKNASTIDRLEGYITLAFLWGVYAPTCNLERQEVWWEIGAVRSLFTGPWVLGGDFNIVRYASEKRNCTRTSVYMNDFSDVIEDMELIDPPLEGGNYTWARGSNLEAVSRIDRIMYSSEWGESFCNVKQELLPRVCSDHVPIALKSGRWSHTKSYFKFEGWWLETEGFNERIKDWWTSFEFEGRPDFILASNLKAMKTKLKDWSSRPLTEGETLQKASVVKEFEEYAKKEEIAWRQRSRTLWIKQGDKNTKFFQRMANAHKRFNHIDKLVVEDQELVDPIEIKTEIISFYRKLYKESENWRPSFHMNQCPSISVEEQQELQKPFEEEEVLLGLKACAVDKAPGPDGYTMGFFVNCWEIVKGDLMSTMQNFHSQEFFEKSFNATYIALISKKSGAKELRDFRPINLIGSVYKLIAKILTERLKKVMHKLVDTQQMAFLKGRQITDAILIANECLDSRVKEKSPGVMCKLDIEKAYDYVNWSFLLEIMQRMGFGLKWIRWIKFCISTVKFSILINGSPEGFFPSDRGLRQGDPLSPFLFIIVMEGLNNMLKTAHTKGWIRGFNVANEGNLRLEVTHLQYADDTLIFFDAEESQLKILRVILILFEATSGLHINWRKSLIFPINEVNRMQHLTEILGGEIGKLPTVYLGMPLGDKSKSNEIWNRVLERCEGRLSRWKAQYLSRGRRLTLINSVLDALPTYLMSVFPLPPKVEERIDALRRNFLWNGEKEYKGFHLVKWKTVILSKKQGDLGIRNLKKQNKSLMMKWLWRFPKEDQALWVRVIQANLKQLFPDIYLLNQQHEATVQEVWSIHGWNLTYKRRIQDWEVDRLAEFYGTLDHFGGLKEGEDTLRWIHHSKGIFTVSSAYKNLNQMGTQLRFLPWKLIWKVKIPYKVTVFTWLVVKEAVLTQENLMKRGIHMCPRCFFCEQQAETINHLFLHCKVVRQLWHLFTSFRETNWTMPQRASQAIESWNNEGSGSTDQSRWRIVPAVIWWTIWKERNMRCFESSSSPLHRIKMNCIITFCYWCSSEYVDDPIAVRDILGPL